MQILFIFFLYWDAPALLSLDQMSVYEVRYVWLAVVDLLLS